MELRKYLNRDIDVMQIRREDLEEHPEIIERVDMLFQSGAHLYTMVHDGQPVAILGASFLWDGVVEIWSVISDNVHKEPMVFARRVRRLVDEYMKHVHRMQMIVRVGFESAERFAKFLKFEEESRLQKYGPKESHYHMFVRFV